MPTFKIQHLTQYRYDRPVRESTNQIKIFPATYNGQETTRHELLITGQPPVNRFADYWGNEVGWFSVDAPHSELVIDSRMVVKTANAATNPLAVSKLADWEAIRAAVQADLPLLDLTRAEPIAAANKIRQMVGELRHARDTPAVFIQRCSEYIFENFNYQKGITTVETTLDEILEHRAGVCQDFAHVLLQILREEGLPARYVSGYICPNKDGARGAGATHAWVEAWLPGTGWVGIDPTNNTWVSDQHVSLAVGRHFGDCSPVKGTFKGPANQELLVYVSVSYEDGSTFEDSNLVQVSREPALVLRQAVDEGMQQQ
jgi:transglutaminase-like putative cysteine protease